MRRALFLLIFSLPLQLCANMAEPVERGTLGSRPFTSEYVNVLHENLHITIGENFQYADFNVEYTIDALNDGIQIPLLFYASEYLDSFHVFIDGKALKIQKIPWELNQTESTKFDDFAYFFEGDFEDYGYTEIEESSTRSFHVSLSDFIYFETDITKGKHTISVSYRASYWVDMWDWVNEYSFRYALSPANYWKSFGTLEVTLDATAFSEHLTSTIGNPTYGDMDSIATWQFDKLPTETLYISYNPEISSRAQTAIKLGANGFAFIFGIIIFLIHVLFIYFYRKQKPVIRFSFVVIVGSLFFPFLGLYLWMYSYSLIDSIIGEHAAGHHGYTFLVMFFYPFILPVYWGIMWWIDKSFKKKFNILIEEKSNQ